MNCDGECACGANAECDIVEGCVCVDGWTNPQQDGDLVACLEDVNECDDVSTHSCADTSTCTNIDGSYTCDCPPGSQYDYDTNVCEGGIKKITKALLCVVDGLTVLLSLRENDDSVCFE